MMAEARDVKRWVARTRLMLEAPDTSKLLGTTTLGNGAYQLEIQRRRETPRSPHFSWKACGPGFGGTSPSIAELLQFLSLLDSAADVAGGGAGRPPTLSRPYYASEVSCPAMPDAENANAWPGVPLGIRTTPADMATQFVVDTAGRVEPGSIRFLPNADRTFVRAARATIERWQFQPPEIDGTPVRQVVQATVSFGPKPDPRVMYGPQVSAEGGADGWVRVHRANGVSAPLAQQWFEPDSIDAWMARVWRRDPATNAILVDTAALLRGNFLLGPRSGVSIIGLLAKTERGIEMAVGFNGCAGAFNEGGQFVGQGAVFTDAARRAREARAQPVDPRTQFHEARDVSCAAWLPWTRSRIPGFERVWRYPTVTYPASMRRTNARADVLASFVVDTMGFVERNSIVVMPGSDRRAAATVPDVLMELRLRPATRSGMKVRQHVIQILRFEPPPVCLTRDAGPACPRRYSKN
jgi:TonB family protein